MINTLRRWKNQLLPSGTRRQVAYQWFLSQVRAFAPKPDRLINVVIKRLSKRIGSLKALEVISLGCGAGVTERGFLCRSITGVDIYPYHPEAVGKRHLDKFIEYDIRKIAEIIKPKQFDVALCLDIIEHLEKEEGFRLIEDSERIARKAVVFYTPLKWDTNEANVNNPNLWSYKNPYNRHKSLWTVEDFTAKGYEVYLEYPGKNNPEGLIALKAL